MRARRFLHAVLKFLMRLLLRVEVTGLERVPQQGPLIIIINHINFLDGPVALGVIPRETALMTKYELMRNPILGPLAWLYGAWGVRRGQVDRRALRRAEKALAEGKAFLLPPEGHRSGHGRLQPAKRGVAFLALRTNAPILPVAISGVEDFWRNIIRLRRTTVRVTIGQPFRFTKGEGPIRRETLREMTTQAMYQLAALLPPRYRGVYNDLSQASVSHLQFLPLASA